MFLLKPYDDELFSSWLIRLARKNYTVLSNLIFYIFKGNKLSLHTTKLHIKDLDLYQLDEEQKDILYKATNVLIDNLQLFKLTGYLDESVDRYNKKWISEIKATIHNSKHFFGTRFCPKCLAETPYIRQLWRVMFYNICNKHQCYLLTKCEKCNATFMYINNEQTREFYLCCNCNYDLRLSNTLVAKKKYIQNQNKLINILNYGYYKFNQRYYYSIGLFYILKKLIHNLMDLNQINKKYINEVESYLLAKLISHSLFLLDNFPYRLNKFFTKNKLRNHYKIYRNNRKLLPYWFLSNLNYKSRIENVR